MEMQELKNTISAIETAENNIESWNKLQNRELAIIPTDSEYYKEFKEWKKTKGACYDGEKEKAPMYISGSKTTDVLSVLIKHQEDFMKPHKDKLQSVLTPAQADA